VLEAEVENFGPFSVAWADAHSPALLAGSGTAAESLVTT